MAISRTDFTRSDLGYPSAYDADEAAAAQAKQEFFKQMSTKLQGALETKGLNLAKLIDHTFFVQGEGCEEICVNFKDAERQDPFCMMIPKSHALYPSAFKAMTGFEQGKVPLPRSRTRPIPTLKPRPQPARKRDESRTLAPLPDPSPRGSASPPSAPIELVLAAIESQRRDFLTVMSRFSEQTQRDRHEEMREMMGRITRMEELYLDLLARNLDQQNAIQERWMETMELMLRRRDELSEPRSVEFASALPIRHRTGTARLRRIDTRTSDLAPPIQVTR